MATYEMEYPSLREAMLAIAGDLQEGRVETIQSAGRPLSPEDLHAVAKWTVGST